MSSSQLHRCGLLVCGLVFSCAGYGQSIQAPESDTLRKQMQELSTQKQHPMSPQPGAEKDLVKPPPVATVPIETVKPPLACQTYPDGRTECK